MRLYKTAPTGAVSRARRLRREATEAEKHLRRALKETFPYLKWRFQVPMGGYCADFLCFSERLVIEVDGGQHAQTEARDAARTRFIEREGYRVLRFWNNDVLGNTDGVIETIQNSLSHREREGARAAQPRGKGEGEKRSSRTRPHPAALSRLAPLPAGEGKKGEL